MNVLIFEYITGGGLVTETLSNSLVREGELMLNAVANDFSDLNDVEVSVLRDYRLVKNPSIENAFVVNVENTFDKVIDEISSRIDALLIIAPESDDILVNLCKKYSGYSFILLNSSIEAVEITSDKLKTFEYLQSCGIKQIPTYSPNDLHSIAEGRIIIKPKDGVGCERLQVMESLKEASKFINQSDAEKFIVQPYLKGQSASLSLLCWDQKCSLLSANIQDISELGKSLELKQCVVNNLNSKPFIDMSNVLAKALPGLKGYIGVDVLITEDEIYLIEINPRLTTSYVGLKSALGINPAELILSAFVNKKLPEFSHTKNTSVAVEVGAECAA